MADRAQEFGDEEPEEGEIQDDDEEGLLEDVSSAEELSSPAQELKGRSILPSQKYSLPHKTQDCLPRHSLRKSCIHKPQLVPSCTGDTKSKLNVTKYRNECNIASREVRHVRLNSFVKTDLERDKSFEYKNMIVECKPQGPKSLQDEDVVHEKENRHGCRDTAKVRKENRRRRHRSLQMSDKKSSSDSESDVEKKKRKQANDGVKRKQETPKKSEGKSKNSHKKRSQSPKRAKHRVIKKKACKKCSSKKISKLAGQRSTDEAATNQENTLLKRLQAMMGINVPSKKDDVSLDTNNKDYNVVEEVVNDIVNATCDELEKQHTSNISAGSEEVASLDSAKEIEIVETVEKKVPEVITIEDSESSSSEENKEISSEPDTHCSKPEDSDKKGENITADPEVLNDEDEDLLQLRMLALQSSRRKETRRPNKEEDEILQLRLEALRSAVLKKYKDRKQRGRILKSKQCSLKTNTLEQQNNEDKIEDDFQFSPPGFSPPCPAGSSPIPVLDEGEPDETTTIVDMDLANTDDEKELENANQAGVMDDFCKQIPLPEETSITSHLGSKEDSVQASSSKTSAVEHPSEPLQSAWKPPPPPLPPPTFPETEINFSYNCQMPETYNSNIRNSCVNFSNSMPSYAASSTTYQCQTYSEFYLNNLDLPTTDLDGAPLDPLPESYDVHLIPPGTYDTTIPCSSNSRCFTPTALSSAEMSLPYMDRNIVSNNIVISTQENKTPCSVVNNIVENTKETESVYPNSVASYESAFLQPYSCVGTESVSHSSLITIVEAMPHPSPQPVAVSESTSKPSEDNTEEDEEFLRAQLLTSLAAKKKKAVNTALPAKIQADAGLSQKNNLSTVENSSVSMNVSSEKPTFSLSSKNVEMSAGCAVVQRNISSESVTTIANESKILHRQNQYNGQDFGEKIPVKKTNGRTVRQQILVKNALKLNKFTSVNKPVTPTSSNKVSNTPKSWKKTLRKTVSPLNLKQWTKINKRNIHLVANFSHSSAFTVKQPSAIMQSSANVRTLATKSTPAGIMLGTNRNNKLTSLKVTVPAKASDRAHVRRTVAESKRDAGSSDPAVSRFVIHLGEDSDSGEENDQNRHMTPVSKRRCILKDGCPVLTVSTENVPPVSDMCRVQPSSVNGSTKPKSAQLPGSAPSADFERSVDMFLKQARLSHESRTPGPGSTSSEKTSEKQGNVSVTPLAVRHLPSSQQEEYRRLKQQIAELEAQRRKRLKQPMPSKISIRKSNSPCSPSRVVTENSSEKSFKIVISNTVPEKKQLPQTANIPQKIQDIPPKSVESEVMLAKSATKTPVVSKALPPQNLSVFQKVREVPHKKKDNCDSTETTNRNESFDVTNTLMVNLDTSKEFQKKCEPSTKTGDILNTHECNTNVVSSNKNSEVTGKKNEITEVHLKINETSEEAVEEKLAKLADAELRLLSRRYALLDDLTNMSALLRQVAVERTIEEECIREVERLQLELKRAEEKLSQQRNLISNMKTDMAESYQKVAKGRLECIKISKACLALGTSAKGDKYKVPAGGAQLMNLKLQQVYAQTRELSNKSKSDDDDGVVCADLCAETEIILQETNDEKDPGNAETVESNVPKVSQEESDIKVPSPASSAEVTTEVQSDADNLNTSCALNVEQNTSAIVEPSKDSTECSFKDIKTISTGGAHDHCMDWYEPVLGRDSHEDRLKLPSSLVAYRSPLEHLKFNRGESGNREMTVDPHSILCPFELMGSCQDDECSYQHQGR